MSLRPVDDGRTPEDFVKVMGGKTASKVSSRHCCCAAQLLQCCAKGQ
jgi:hypothetical protein